MVSTKGELRVVNSSEPINSCDSGLSDSNDSWAAEYLALSKVYDFAHDPDDPLVTRQSKVRLHGLLFPLNEKYEIQLQNLFAAHDSLYHGGPRHEILTGRMQQMILHAAERSKDKDVGEFTYISLDPQDYTIFSCHMVNVPVVKIHTRPEACWFIGMMRFEGTALGLSMGRMRVERNRTPAGAHLISLRSKYRALTNPVIQQEAVDVYRRLIDPTS